MSPKYIRAYYLFTVDSMTSITRHIVTGTLRNPKGILIHSCKPWCEAYAIFSRSLLCTSICRHPLFASGMENILASPRESMHSSIRGEGYESLMVTALSLHESTKHRNVPFFFETNTIEKAHSVCASSATFIASIILISSLSASCSLGPAQYVATQIALGSGEDNSTLCVALLICPRPPPQNSWKCPSLLINRVR